MLHDSPLRHVHEARAKAQPSSPASSKGGVQRPGAAVGQRLQTVVEYIPYGPLDAHGLPTCEVPAAFGEVELEYAAIRRGAALMDSPHRGTLVIEGPASQRRDFLNRMVTQELRDLAAGTAKETFWLNRKGRIEADLLLVELEDRMLVDVDIHQAAQAARTLKEFVFAEDVLITDASSDHHHLAIHGPNGPALIAAAADMGAITLDPLRARAITIAGATVVAARRDQTGDVGVELIMPYGAAADVWAKLLSASDELRGRPIGWYAYNIARIEAGTPLFNIDFGPTNLPHESGIIGRRVSFAKGCYLGQEVVARMESRGHSKNNLVGLRIHGDLLPVAGAQVFRLTDGSMGEQIGSITSSTLSPMLGAAPIAFATIKTAAATAGSSVLVNAEGSQVTASVQGLRFWPAHAA